MTAPETLHAVVERQTPGFAAALNVELVDDTLGVLDPDTIQAQMREFFALFGLPEEQADGVAAFLGLAITQQPSSSQQAFINTSKLLAFIITNLTTISSSVADLGLTDDTLGLLDPDTIQATVNEWFGNFGLNEDAMTAAVALVGAIVTDQPDTPQAALLSVSKLLGLLFTNSTIAAQDIAALEDGNPPLFDSGANAGGRWAIVCTPGCYSTDDPGDLATIAPAGYVDVIRAVPLAGDDGRRGDLVSFLEWLTQRHHDPEVLDIDLDNDESAFAIWRDEVGLFNEHCRTSTPSGVSGGEHAAGRIYSFRSGSDPAWVDTRLRLVLGQPLTIRFEHRFDLAGQSRKTFWLRTAEPWADLTDTEGRYWWKVAELTYPGTDSVAAVGQPWWVGLNAGLMGVEHIDRRPLTTVEGVLVEGDPGSIFLHFDTADLQEDGSILSSVVDGQSWARVGTPYIFDTTPAGLAAKLDGKLDAARLGAAGGAASLGEDGKVPAEQLPASSSPVASVFGREGAVVAADQDYTAAQVVVNPSGLAVINGSGTRVSTALAQLDAAVNTRIDKSIVDAKGDLLVGTAADTVARLAAPTTLRRRALQTSPSATSGLDWLPIDYRYVPQAGEIVSVQATGSSGVASLGLNAMMGHHVWLAAGPIDRIGVYHTANAAAVWRVLLYPVSEATGLPVGEALLLDAGTLDLSSGAIGWAWKTITYSVPTEGLYAPMVQCVTAASPSVHNLVYGGAVQPLVHGIPINASSVGRQQVGFTVTAPSSSAPATCPSTFFSWLGTVPRIHVRYA